ncbi:MAG: ABC transporter substrate-binding protein [Sphingomonadales bacterium]
MLSLLLGMAFGGCDSGQDGRSLDPGPARLVMSGTKPGVRLDPHMDAQWEVLYILSAVYETLVNTTADGKVIAGLATDWQVSPDGLNYVFKLKPDVFFHDGTRFDADAVKVNLQRILSLGPQSLKARSLLPPIQAIDAIDPTTIKIELQRPDSSFLYALSLPYLGMASPNALQRWGDRYHHHQAGTGPFAFVDYEVGNFYRLERRAGVADGSAVMASSGVRPVDEIIWRFLPEPSTRGPALISGDIDIAFDIDPVEAKALELSDGIAIAKAYLTGQPAFWFLNTAKPPTDDIRVRKAILHGADMQAAVDAVMQGYNPKAHGPLAAVTPGYAAEVEALYPHDPDRARALLAQAGWLDRDGDGIRERDGQPLRIALSMVSWGKSRIFSEVLFSQLRAIGIEVKLEMMDFSVQMQAGRQGEKNMLFMGGSGHSAADSLRGFFHSENTASGFAWSKWRDPVLDRYLDQAIIATNDQERDRLYRQAQIRIMEQALIVPIYDYVLLVGVNPRVQGLGWGTAGLAPNFAEIHIGSGKAVR